MKVGPPTSQGTRVWLTWILGDLYKSREVRWAAASTNSFENETVDRTSCLTACNVPSGVSSQASGVESRRGDDPPG